MGIFKKEKILIKRCEYCKNKLTKECYGNRCLKCKDAHFLCDDLFNTNSSLRQKAKALFEAFNKDIITTECFIIKRDRLLHLQKIAEDKYLTKLKKEVDKI